MIDLLLILIRVRWLAHALCRALGITAPDPQHVGAWLVGEQAWQADDATNWPQHRVDAEIAAMEASW